MKLNFPPMPDLNEDFIYNLANQNMSASAVDLATGQAMAQDILNYRGEVDAVTSALETSVYLITGRDDEIARLRKTLESIKGYAILKVDVRLEIICKEALEIK
jgi:hypothetical protein